jgi:radical SAM superfamily enzyme
VNALDSARVAAEIKLFCEQAPGADIAVLDPTFNTSTAHAVAILDSFHAHDFTGRLSLQVRPEKITHTFLEAAARLGPGRVTLEMGVQTAVAKELDEIGRVAGACSERSLRKVGEKLALVGSFGLDAELSLMFALPHQSVASLQESVGWCRAHLPNARLSAFPLMLLRGTLLHQRREALGLVEGFVSHPLVERIQSFIPHVVETPTMSRSDWVQMADIAGALEPKNRAP